MQTIKYTGCYEKTGFYIRCIKQFITFKRNEWKNVQDNVADELLQDFRFISKLDFICNLSEVKTPIRLGLFRFGALGDLIMLLPVARYIKRVYKHTIVLITQSQHIDFFKNLPDAFDQVLSNESFHRNKVDKMVMLDGCLEVDHSTTNHERLIHRVQLYEKFFGIHVDKYDFSIPIAAKTNEYVEGLLNASL